MVVAGLSHVAKPRSFYLAVLTLFNRLEYLEVRTIAVISHIVIEDDWSKTLHHNWCFKIADKERDRLIILCELFDLCWCERYSGLAWNSASSDDRDDLKFSAHVILKAMLMKHLH